MVAINSLVDISNMIINSKYSRNSMISAINEIELVIDGLLHSFYSNDEVISLLNEDYDFTTINHIITIAKSIAIVKGNPTGSDEVINWKDVYNKTFIESCIPHEFKDDLKNIFTSLSTDEIRGISDINSSVKKYYEIENAMSQITTLVDLLSLLDVRDDNSCIEYHEIYSSLFDKFDAETTELGVELMTNLMYHALLSKDNDIRDRFITISEI